MTAFGQKCDLNHRQVTNPKNIVNFGSGISWNRDTILTISIPKYLGVPWFGDGRLAESSLAAVALLYGCMVALMPEATYRESIVGWDLESWGRWLAIPLLVKSSLTGTGLLLNSLGQRYARYLRFSGAMLGCWIWSAFSIKYLKISDSHTLSLCFTTISTFASIRIILFVVGDIPHPGRARVV